MALLTGLTPDGVEVPVQVKPDGKLVAEGLTGPAGPQGGPGAISGTAALPGLTPVGDPDTGIWSPGADQLAISTSGIGRLFIDLAGNTGIGGVPSTYKLDAIGNGISTRESANSSRLALGSYDAGGITYINSDKIGTGSYLPLTFATSAQERVRITADGMVGIGTTAPRSLLHASGNISANDGLDVRSPDGSWWNISVSDAGQVTATSVAVRKR